DIYSALSVDVSVTDDYVRSVLHGADIPQVDRRAVLSPYRSIQKVVEFPAERHVGGGNSHQIISAQRSGRHDDTAPIHRADGLVRRDVVGVQPIRIQTDHNRTLISAERRRSRDALQNGEYRPNAIQRDILHLAYA